MNLCNLFKTSDGESYPAGRTIFEEGSAGDVMYVVLEGEVEVRLQGKSLRTVGAGELLGEMALIDAKARSASAVARTDCRLAPVDEKRFLFMVQQTPFFALHVMRVLAERLRHMNTQATS